MSKRPETWQPVDHACRMCGGRVVRVIGHGPTGGGDPVWRCADCGIASASMGPECICWCGFRHKGQTMSGYRCVPIAMAKSDPVIEATLMRAGYLSDDLRRRPQVEIAVVSESAIEWARARADGGKH